MARMVDVAKRAGVSVKTVSRVLNNEPHVQEHLRSRVRQAATDLGYVPSSSARSLRSRRSYTIQLLSVVENNAYANAVQFGALQACQSLGYQLAVILLARDDDRPAAERVEDRLKTGGMAGRPDGVILTPPLSTDQGLHDVLRRHGVPIARVGPSGMEDSHADIRIDEVQAARELTQLLLDHGHRRVAYLHGKPSHMGTHLRFEGFRLALKDAGLKVDPALVFEGTFDFASGFDTGQHLFGMPEPPTAVFAANDDMAAGIVVAAHRAGVAVPETLSVAGFDDSEIAERMWPALTTVRQPVVELGRIAAEHLMGMAGRAGHGSASSPEPPGMVPHSLIRRASVGPAPA